LCRVAFEQLRRPFAGEVAVLRHLGDLNRIRFIEQTATAKLNVSYYA
jgi:hypothetical protein